MYSRVSQSVRRSVPAARRQLSVGAQWLDYFQVVGRPTSRDKPRHDHVMFVGGSEIQRTVRGGAQA